MYHIYFYVRVRLWWLGLLLILFTVLPATRTKLRTPLQFVLVLWEFLVWRAEQYEDVRSHPTYAYPTRGDGGRPDLLSQDTELAEREVVLLLLMLPRDLLRGEGFQSLLLLKRLRPPPLISLVIFSRFADLPCLSSDPDPNSPGV